MLKLLSFVLLLFSGINSLKAQLTEKNLNQPAKYGSIETAEFEIKPSGKDSAASAIKIFEKGDVRFELNPYGSFRYVFVKHTRILILKKDAYDLANIEIGLYKSSNGMEENITDFNATTYNVENGKIASQKIGKGAKFSDRYDKNITIRKFTLPNIKEGSIIEYKYEIRSDFIFNLRDWTFQSSIPVLLSDFTVTIPEYFNYKRLLKGYTPVTQVEKKQLTESFNSTVTDKNGGRSERLAFTCPSVRERYLANNVPALKNEPFITTMDDYTTKIEFELSSTQFPNQGYKSYTETWDKIISTLNEEESFGGLLKNSAYAQNLTETIVKTEKDPLKKLDLIFKYIKQNVKFNGTENKYSSEKSLKSILEKKAGNAADINLLLVNMLKQAGLNSYPILLSTRSNGLHPGHPLLSKFNYVIAGVDIDSTKYFLDATNKHLGANMLELDRLNHKGLAMNIANKTAEWIPIELKATSQSFLTYQLKLSKDNVLTGLVFERKTQFSGLSGRQRYQASQSEEEFLKDYKKDRNGLKIQGFSISNLDSLSLPLIMAYTATIEDMVEEAGNLVYFTPLLYERTKENPFKLEERNFPVDLGYQNEEVYRIIIELPENMVVEKLPKSETIKLGDNSAYFTYLTVVEGKTISVVSRINFGKSSYTADAYFELKELFQKIVTKQAEQIVLKKI